MVVQLWQRIQSKTVLFLIQYELERLYHYFNCYIRTLSKEEKGKAK